MLSLISGKQKNFHKNYFLADEAGAKNKENEFGLRKSEGG